MRKLSIFLSVALMALLLLGQPVYATDAPAEETQTEEVAEPVETTEPAEATEPAETTDETTVETTTTEVTQEIEEQVEREDVLFGLDMKTLLIGGAILLVLIALLASSGRKKDVDREVRTSNREVHTTREVIDRDPVDRDRVVRDERVTRDPHTNRETVVTEERVVEDHDDNIRR